MSEYTNAADHIRQLARHYQHMQDVVKTLDGLGSLQQVLDEKKTAIAEAGKALALATAELDAEKRKTAEVKARLAALISEANAKADAVGTEATTTAEAIVDKARAEAQALVAASRAVSERQVARATEQAREALTEVENLRKEHAEKSAELAAVSAELEKLNKAIARARGTLAAFMEGKSPA